ncbi:MAG TPA: dynamin family protein [Blastocatellia bacterium]|nr:dynamin family protein [Blastocatellia bacterium]
MNQYSDNLIELVAGVAASYGITAIEPLLASCRAVSRQHELTIAVAGRFKAGKSSFLNHLIGRHLLPVGVVPVTAVITEISYGPSQKALVHFLDGRIEPVPIDDIRCFIAESENPENVKRVSRVTVELPELEPFRGLCFVDMPGLESSFAHNTDVSLRWLPNAALALVAISVDTPLSRHDLDLLKSLRDYTPGISILLTKADLLDEAERAEVLAFIRDQLTRAFDAAPEIFPYSVRPGFEHLRTHLEGRLMRKTLSEFEQHRNVILGRKLETLLRDCEEYLTLALTAAETVNSERGELEEQVIGDKEAVEQVKHEVRLLIRDLIGGTRTVVSTHLEESRAELEAYLLEDLKTQFPMWAESLRSSLDSFERWLRRSLSEALAAISDKQRAYFLAPLETAKRRVLRLLQVFRDELSEKTESAFGVPLRTNEVEIQIEEPHSPDIWIGRVFDRNWELLSPIIPIQLARSIVERHFRRRVPEIIETNLSRLATQWEESIDIAMTQIRKVAEQRSDELAETVGRLVASSSDDAPQIRVDLERLNIARDQLRGERTEMARTES